MKRIPFVITALYPYTVFLAVLAVFISPLIGKIPSEDIRTALGMLLMPCIIMTCIVTTLAVIASTVYHVITVRGGTSDPLSAASAAMKLKLIHIPAYIVIFTLAILCLSTIFTVPFALFLAFADLVTILATGTIQLAAITAAGKGRMIALAKSVLLAVLGFLYVVDVFSSVSLVSHIKRRTINSTHPE